MAWTNSVLESQRSSAWSRRYNGTAQLDCAGGEIRCLVEAAIYPLIPALYSDRKTAKLIALHAWFPGVIVLGGLTNGLLRALARLDLAAHNEIFGPLPRLSAS